MHTFCWNHNMLVASHRPISAVCPCTIQYTIMYMAHRNSYFNAATESGCLLNETQPVIIVLMWSVAQRQIFYFYHPFRVDSSKESLWPVLLRVHFWLTVYIQLQIGFQLKIHDFKFETFKVWCTWGTNNETSNVPISLICCNNIKPSCCELWL